MQSDAEIKKNLTQSHEVVIDVSNQSNNNLSSLASDLEESIDPNIVVKKELETKHAKKAKIHKVNRN